MEKNSEKGLEKTGIGKTYIEVLEKFPEIRKEEIGIEEANSLLRPFFVLGLHMNIEKWPVSDKRPKANLIVGLQFYLLADKEKEAAIAHELGHYVHNVKKSYNAKRAERMRGWNKSLKMYASKSLKEMLDLDEREKHKFERLEKWYIMKEIDADNKAANAGYGKPMLLTLKKLSKNKYEHISPVYQKEMTMRINNLEDKIRQGEES